MKLKMVITAMLFALLSVMFTDTVQAQPRGRYHGGYGNGYGNNYGRGRYYAPRYVAPRYYGTNNCGPQYSNGPAYYGGYNNCGPRYARVARPYCAPRYNNYYGGGYRNNGCYGGNNGYYGGSGVSVNVNTPGFSGSFNSGNGGYYNGGGYRRR